EKVMPQGVSNVAPQLRILWDTAKLGATGNDILAELLAGEPRIVTASDETSITVMPYMMMAGDDRIAGGRIRAVLAKPPRRKPQPGPAGAQPVSGKWNVHIEYVRGEAGHSLDLEEADGKLSGRHRGEFLSGDVRGTREGARIRLRSSHPYEGTSI